MHRRVRVRPPRWVFAYVLASSIVFLVLTTIFFRNFSVDIGAAMLVFYVVPIVVGLVAAYGLWRGSLPGAHVDLEFEDPDEGGSSADAP